MYAYELISGSQKGQIHRENQDQPISRVVTGPVPSDKIYIAGVSDGVSKTPYGGSVARWLAGSIHRDDILVADSVPLPEQFLAYLHRLHAAFIEKFATMPDMLASAATLSIVAIQGNRAECFWAGDSPIYHTQRRADGLSTVMVSTPDVAAGTLTAVFSGAAFNPHHKSLELAEGDVLTIATDGLRHQARNISQIYADEGINRKTIGDMIAYSVRFSGSDDTTLSVAHRTR